MQSAGFFFLVALIFVYGFFYSRKIVGWQVGDSLEVTLWCHPNKVHCPSRLQRIEP
ncbi:MAG TPA: hypothetical protein P5186_29405 [Candidatus Paceibacterota bacterium]|nr:hypothetical protein [Candidatus Paceibacterota bacterium]